MPGVVSGDISCDSGVSRATDKRIGLAWRPADNDGVITVCVADFTEPLVNEIASSNIAQSQ